jgi:hypothetical protein
MVEFGTCLAPWRIAAEYLQLSCQHFFLDNSAEPRAIIHRVFTKSVVKDSADTDASVDDALELIQPSSSCLMIFDVADEDRDYLTACFRLLKQFDSRLGRFTHAILRTRPFREHTRMQLAKLIGSLPVCIQETDFAPVDDGLLFWLRGAFSWPGGTSQKAREGAVPTIAPPLNWKLRAELNTAFLKRWLPQHATPNFTDPSSAAAQLAHAQRGTRGPHACEIESLISFPEGFSDKFPKDKCIREHQRIRLALLSRSCSVFVASFVLSAFFPTASSNPHRRFVHSTRRM